MPCCAGRGGLELGLDGLRLAAASPDGAAGGERLDALPPPALLLFGFGLLPSPADRGGGGESGTRYITRGCFSSSVESCRSNFV